MVLTQGFEIVTARVAARLREAEARLATGRASANPATRFCAEVEFAVTLTEIHTELLDVYGLLPPLPAGLAASPSSPSAPPAGAKDRS